MAMKEMNQDLRFVLVFTTKLTEVPTIHGYSMETRRDEAFETFQQTGRFMLHDENLSVEKMVEPVYVARFNMVDGSLNTNKVKGEIDGLT